MIFRKTQCDELVKNLNAIQTIETSNLVKKANYSTKLTKFKKTTDHEKFIANLEFNKLTAENSTARLKQAK